MGCVSRIGFVYLTDMSNQDHYIAYALTLKSPWFLPTYLHTYIPLEGLMQVYCLKCRAHRDVNDAQQVTLKNGRPATRGKCSVCSATVFRIGKAS